MARVPRLEAAYGQDRLAHLHRLVGFTSFNLMLAHIVLITWGYAAGQLSQTPSTLWNLVVDLSRHAARHRRHGLPLPRGVHEHQGRAATDPLRVVAPAAPLRLRRRRPGPAAPALDRPAVPVLPRAHVLLVDGVGGGRGFGPGLAGRPAGVAQPVAPARGHLGGPRDGRRRVGLPAPAAGCTDSAWSPGSSSPGASSGGPAGRAPTPTRCRPPPTAAACGSPCRRSATAAPRPSPCAPVRGCSSRDRSAGSARAPGPGAASP